MPNELLHVDNRTTYDTRDIRSAVLACEKYLDMTGPRRVVVVYARRGQVTGYAYYPRFGATEGVGVRLRLPKIHKGEVITDQLAREFFWLVEHELSHSRGVEHRELRGGPAGQVHGVERRPNWAADLQLRLKPTKQKPSKAAVFDKKYAKATTDLARWQRKLKLANTKVKKLKSKLVRLARARADELAKEAS